MPMPQWQPPAAPHPKVRWGFGDAAWAVMAGIVFSAVVGLIMIGIRYPHLASGTLPKTDAIDSAVTAVAQFAAMALLLYLTVGRRGRGLRRELGLMLQRSDGWWILVGMASSIALGAVSLPISSLWDDGHHGKQQIGEQVRNSSSWARVLLVIVVVFVAPVIEESIFRGVVLRSALRRMSAGPAVLVSGATFATLHLLDVTTFPALPALFVLGTGSAIVATRSGNLSRSIYLHMGFNLLGAITLLNLV